MMSTEQICTFKLNPKFYSKNSILTTINAFNDLCFFEFDQEKFEIKIKTKEEYDLRYLGYEFSNYCLSIMKQNGV